VLELVKSRTARSLSSSVVAAIRIRTDESDEDAI